VCTDDTTTGRIVDTKHNNRDYQTVPTTLIYSPLVDTTVCTEVVGTNVETENNIGD